MLIWFFVVVGAAFLVTAPAWLFHWLVQWSFARSETPQAQRLPAGRCERSGIAFDLGRAARRLRRSA